MNVQLTPAVVDQASNRVIQLWELKRQYNGTDRESEGLFSWLLRMFSDAIQFGDVLPSGKRRYAGMKFGFITVADPRGVYYSLTSIERVK